MAMEMELVQEIKKEKIKGEGTRLQGHVLHTIFPSFIYIILYGCTWYVKIV
jgi:hypothetical protein